MENENLFLRVIGISTKIKSPVQLIAYSIGVVLLITINFLYCKDYLLISIPLAVIIIILFIYLYFSQITPPPIKIEGKIPDGKIKKKSDLKGNLINDITEDEFTKLYTQITEQVDSNGIKAQQRYGVYIACPMASFEEDEREIQKNQLAQLIMQLKRKYNDVLIECPAAIQTNSDLNIKGDKFEDPNKALMLCYTRILFSKVFMLIYPKKILSSTIFEFGLAIAFGKPIIVFQKSGEKLPYLLEDIIGLGSIDVQVESYNGEIKDITKIINDRYFKIFKP